MIPVVLSFPDDTKLAEAVAKHLPVRLHTFHWRHFPDGESLIAISADVAAADVVIIASLTDADRKALPLRFLAQTARELGARSVGLIAPYLAYMRQDARFHVGEAVSARAFAQFLDQTVDWLITVDPHLHRIAKLDDIYRMPVSCISAAPELAAWIRGAIVNPLLIGPDGESEQWVANVARLGHMPYQILKKHRRGDRDVDVSAPERDRLRGFTPVLLDDIVSTGRTLIAAASQLCGFGSLPPICVVIHPVFVGDAYERLGQSGVARVVSTDSILHVSNAISLSKPIACALYERLAMT